MDLGHDRAELFLDEPVVVQAAEAALPAELREREPAVLAPLLVAALPLRAGLRRRRRAERLDGGGEQGLSRFGDRGRLQLEDDGLLLVAAVAQVDLALLVVDDDRD